MKLLSGALAVLLLVAADPAPPDNTLSAKEREEGWVLLFDGRTLDGWMTSGRKASRRPADAGVLSPRGCGDYMLVFHQPLGDFVLSLDFQIAREQPRGTYNSGVFFRTSSLDVEPGKDVGSNGLEIAIDYDPKEPERAGYHDTGAIYDLVKPRRCAARPPGAWNHLVLSCRGPSVSVEINGEVVTVMDLDAWTDKLRRPDGTPHKFATAYRDHPRRGFLGLQDHGAEVSFKNIKAKPLAAADRDALAAPRRG